LRRARGASSLSTLDRPKVVSRSAIEVRLAEAGSRLNPGRRRLIQATLESSDETYFLSSRALARRLRVDPATIVRTIQVLGYERYADFAADLRKHFISRITPYRIMEATAREKGSVVDHVRRSLERDMSNLNQLRSGLDPARVVELAKRIHRARRVLVVGVDLAASLSWYLAYGLVPLGFDAEAPVGSSGNLRHKVRLLTSKDLLIAISFGRCLRDTIEAALLARERKVPTFGITDSDTTPIAKSCDSYLLASVASSTFAGSYVVPQAVLNAVLLACAELRAKRSLKLLRQTEKEYLSGPRWYESVPEEDAGRQKRKRSRNANE
jgi:DNA-binding MurR/RpiR family transcriptional regulator